MFRATVQAELSVGRTITELRKSKGLTKRELAKAIGAEEHTIGRWEAGTRSPRMTDFAKILVACDAFMCVIDH